MYMLMISRYDSPDATDNDDRIASDAVDDDASAAHAIGASDPLVVLSSVSGSVGGRAGEWWATLRRRPQHVEPLGDTEAAPILPHADDG